MKVTTAVHVTAVARSFDETLRSLQHALSGSGLSVVEQLPLSHSAKAGIAAGGRQCTLLMVDSPLLLFEAVALERSAAAFIPLHVVVTGDRHSTCVHWAHPSHAIGLRLSPTARGAIDARREHQAASAEQRDKLNVKLSRGQSHATPASQAGLAPAGNP